MPCPNNNCGDSSNISLTGSWFPGSPCDNSDCGSSAISAVCVTYNGANLECSGVETGDNLETALQKIDEQICSITGDYSTYTMNCLPAWWGSAISTQSEFVDAITAYACEIADSLENFTGVEFPEFELNIQGQIDDITGPGITCASAGVTNADSLVVLLQKYCSKFEDIDDALDISTVIWNNCFVVVGTPATLAEGFQVLADQICDIYDLVGGGILPTFNNYTSCIGGTSDDTLVETIELIKTRLCLLDVVDFDTITWGCWGTGSTTMQQFVEKTVSYLNVLNDFKYDFDGGDFTLTAIDPMDPCAGQLVSLAVPASQDRFVASNASDVSPSTLVDKLTSTGSISFDDSSNTDVSLDITDADYGDITVSGTGSVWTIDNDVVTFAKMQNISTGVLLGRSTAGSGDVETITIGSGLLLSGGILSATGSGSTIISDLTAATAGNSIDNTNYAQTWSWSTLTGINGLRLSSTSTAGTSQLLFDVRLSGAFLSPNGTGTAAYIESIKTGTTSTNNALVAFASGATANYGIVCSGAGGQWGTAAGASIYAQGRMRIDGQIDTYGSTSGVVSIKPAATAGTWTLTLPDNDGTADDVLITDGSGTTSWKTLVPVNSGSYTPTLTNDTNLSASTAYTTYWYLVGEMVTVFGQVDVDPTAAGDTILEMSLPAAYPSGLTGPSDLAGTASCSTVSDEIVTVLRGGADTAVFRWNATNTTNHALHFHFSYFIVPA